MERSRCPTQRCGCTGFSFVFQQVDRYLPAVQQVNTQLSERYGSKSYSNWYLTPPGPGPNPIVVASVTSNRCCAESCAYAPHNDLEDNFVVQLEGSKRWRVYNTTSQAPQGGKGHRRPRRFRSASRQRGSAHDGCHVKQGPSEGGSYSRACGCHAVARGSPS